MSNKPGRLTLPSKLMYRIFSVVLIHGLLAGHLLSPDNNVVVGYSSTNCEVFVNKLIKVCHYWT